MAGTVDDHPQDVLSVESLRLAARDLLERIETGRYLRFSPYPEPLDPGGYIIGGLRPANPRERKMLRCI